MDMEEIGTLFEKLLEAREAGYGTLLDSMIEQDKDITPNPVMLMKELEHFVQRAKRMYREGTYDECPEHWEKDMNTRMDALAGCVHDIWMQHTFDKV